MFSGIVEKMGTVLSIDRHDAAAHLRVDTGFEDLALGESVAVNGTCLTVAEQSRDGQALFFVSSETLGRTNIETLHPAQRINLERALPVDGRLSGHIVQGHVDGMAKVEGMQEVGEAREIEFSFSCTLGRYCIEKGSITLNGVSLTINSIMDFEQESRVRVMLIPHTWSHTNLRDLSVGNFVNVEVDLLAKYMERLCRPYLSR